MLSGNEILKLEEFYHIFSFEPNFQVVAKLDGMRFIINQNIVFDYLFISSHKPV